MLGGASAEMLAFRISGMPPQPESSRQLGAGSASVGGIVRDMDVAPEAYRDVLVAFPPTDADPAPLYRLECSEHVGPETRKPRPEGRGSVPSEPQ